MATDDKTPDPEPGQPAENGEQAFDLGVAAALRSRLGRTRRVAGAEPHDLEEVALYVDGALPSERRAAVEARLAAEPELREVVAELARHDQIDKIEDAAPGEAPAQEPKSNVIPLVIPATRTTRVGQSGAGTLRALPLPEQKKNPMRTAIMGIGAALALAAILFLVTRPNLGAVKGDGAQGAGVSGKQESIAIGFEDGQAVLEVDATIPGELAVLVATPNGTRAVGLCNAKACIVTDDTLPIRVGKNAARAVIGKDNGACAFVLALTDNGSAPTGTRSAAYVDPHAAAKALGAIVSADGCVLESLDQIQGIAGARHIAYMKVP